MLGFFMIRRLRLFICMFLALLLVGVGCLADNPVKENGLGINNVPKSTKSEFSISGVTSTVDEKIVSINNGNGGEAFTNQNVEVKMMPFQIIEIFDPQQAVFFVSVGWTGGFGEAVLDDQKNIVTLSGFPLYLDSDSWDRIFQQEALPACFLSTPAIKVLAEVEMEKITAKNSSIEEADEKTYYHVTINRIDDVFIQAEPCID
ncbi:MAG TPA: hypothetical protein DCY48_03545 [Candidatus Magasanikbacteria bacterium]|nr:MAG: hypothetical protein A3I74_04730 [Candidatus Magasanikbacteria bacterium RIFCSPLOWO2_02_FULL_47_16]OGH79511.1 MAG: hypothetical protein A3C10_01700 [Candidatus Magasanikbacteria bacterium RIFCSPHIGHO2_02_FULL_48_18]OGH81955.1 MAG: hypothetical protein A3G08_01985 [Candidatus Magasanikbacteria bacterium RIFCSPLOWO2_12_FULL_47_9b]HAZ28818.1 hypothetical protein [Candidatus Magasanikbacteria bacterium]